jgi:DNA-binding CsgD family transcriptional regulator
LIQLRGLEQEATVEELAIRDVPTEQQGYRLKGSFIGLDLFGKGPITLITLERPAPDPLSDEALRERFNLSKKESQVLRLLIEGNTNEEIARALFVSPHTVRHHTEHIFGKLSVRSRAEVAARVLRG